MMKSKMSAAAMIVVLALSFQTFAVSGAAIAASATDQTTSSSSKAAAYAKAVYNKAVKLLKEKDIPYAKAYITKHIRSVSQYQATLLVLRLENAMNAKLGAYTDRMFTPGTQETIMKVYKYGEPINTTISKIKDTNLRSLLADLRDSGYRLHTAEGVVFPIIDYKTLLPYKPYISKDIQDYIDIMVVESEKVAVSDAALVIPWSEVIERALAQEVFLKNHPNSNRAKDVRQMLKFNEISLFYGYNNTPLFQYTSNTVNPEALEAIRKAVSGDLSGSSFLTKLKGWYDILKDNDGKLTQEVWKYRADLVPNS
ncbi:MULTISPECIES: hypothetical protein [unclassified Paenibacillus]|uniref:hypothetical protein n=1 Tax=unclassified Paenibacillus TaxID=185978 RepID=UPI000BA55A3E|nr:hypothetical protein [Paenibacillus sp. 7541]PAK51210.1 hypothetical protein CHH75_15945 [Paenibacillus sp. 7541]